MIAMLRPAGQASGQNRQDCRTGLGFVRVFRYTVIVPEAREYYGGPDSHVTQGAVPDSGEHAWLVQEA